MAKNIKTHLDRLLWLAGLETLCPCLVEELYPQCSVCTDIMGPGKHSEKCLQCGGTGKVPRFPMLRQECSTFEGVPIEDWRDDRRCSYCQGRGFIPVDDLEATRKAALENGWTFRLTSYPASGITEVAITGCLGDARFGKAVNKGANEAAIEALCKVMEKEKGEKENG